MEDFKYRSDYFDAYCEHYYGHTNWAYVKPTDANVVETIVIYRHREEKEE